MKKVLNQELTLYFDKFFPYILKKNSKKRHYTVLGIGGNIGNVRKIFQKLFIYLKRHQNLTILKTSPILKNPPFGYLDQKDFFNAVIVAKTNLNPTQLLHFVLKVEKIFKRKRNFPNSPRTLDIDIIFFDKIVIKKNFLTIPHPHYKERTSVTVPLEFVSHKRKGHK